ncbi:MAG: glutaminyl-peptide cyclotransferase, partial [Proteobacteria bacterium]|nr:glutaminyl-peptide cyclotransferase [Pseudomonadota bacterium]
VKFNFLTLFRICLMSLRFWFICVVFEVIFPISSFGSGNEIEVIPWSVVKTFDRPSDSFTQGLLYLGGGFLAESTGLYGRSEIRKFDLKTGKVTAQSKLPDNIFAEGLTFVNGFFYQLSWKENLVFKWKHDPKAGLVKVDSFSFVGEGWGLTNSNDFFYLSNGTSKIEVRDLKDFSVKSILNVTALGAPQESLNELEFVNGVIYANVWQSSNILRIDAVSGKVTGILDMRGLMAENKQLQKNPDSVLNGIAWNPKSKTMFVTGKLWPKIYEIKLNATKASRKLSK